MNKKYVPNDVFRFRISLKEDSVERTVYTKPFPEIEKETEDDFYDEMRNQELLVQKKYFTKERIEELKEELIRKIRESDNPFEIFCVDTDSGYNVTQEELFDIGL